jgi:hypothetical protein
VGRKSLSYGAEEEEERAEKSNKIMMKHEQVVWKVQSSFGTRTQNAK